MSFTPPTGPGPVDPEFGLDVARDKIAREEQYADGMNLLREQRRLRGGGFLRRTLRRLRGRPVEKPAD